jgi:hypothetical protein
MLLAAVTGGVGCRRPTYSSLPPDEPLADSILQVSGQLGTCSHPFPLAPSDAQSLSANTAGMLTPTDF